MKQLLLALFIVAFVPLIAVAQAEPSTKARELLEQKGILLTKEFTAPITLDTKNNTKVELFGFLFASPIDPKIKAKGFLVVLKPTPAPKDERVAYIDLEEAEKLSASLRVLAEVSRAWKAAQKRGNADCEFTTVEGFKVGFFVDAQGAHEGYFSLDGQRVFFPMTPEMMTAVKTPIDAVMNDLKKH